MPFRCSSTTAVGACIDKLIKQTQVKFAIKGKEISKKTFSYGKKRNERKRR